VKSRMVKCSWGTAEMMCELCSKNLGSQALKREFAGNVTDGGHSLAEHVAACWKGVSPAIRGNGLRLRVEGLSSTADVLAHQTAHALVPLIALPYTRQNHSHPLVSTGEIVTHRPQCQHHTVVWEGVE
jgi:hypothetical protein